MIVKAKNIIGLPIYTVKHGKRLDDAVKDVVYDPQTNRVEAFSLSDGGWFSDAKVILLKDIHSIGDDAVVIESSDVIKEASKVKQKVASIAKGENYLTADKVITEDGTDLGKINDLLFESSSGKVEEFEVSQGAFKDVGSGKKTVKVSDIITVGEDAIVVGAYTIQKFDKQAQQRGLQGRINETKKQTPSVMEQVKQKVQEMREHPKTKEMTMSLKEKTTNAKDTTQQNVQNKRKLGAVGKYVTVNILSQRDEMLAKRGDMVTHKLLKQAEKNGVLEQVLGNTTNEPIQTPQQTQQNIKQQEKSAQNQQQTSTSNKPQKGIVIESMEEEVIVPQEKQFSYPMSGTIGGKSEHTTKKRTKSAKNKK